MNPINPTNPAQQDPRAWSAHLGTLAAGVSAAKTDASFNGSAPPQLLASILRRLQQRHQARRESLRDVRNAEFIAP